MNTIDYHFSGATLKRENWKVKELNTSLLFENQIPSSPYFIMIVFGILIKINGSTFLLPAFQWNEGIVRYIKMMVINVLSKLHFFNNLGITVGKIVKH